jgi:hypothetical protein
MVEKSVSGSRYTPASFQNVLPALPGYFLMKKVGAPWCSLCGMIIVVELNFISCVASLHCSIYCHIVWITATISSGENHLIPMVHYNSG